MGWRRRQWRKKEKQKKQLDAAGGRLTSDPVKAHRTPSKRGPMLTSDPVKAGSDAYIGPRRGNRCFDKLRNGLIAVIFS